MNIDWNKPINRVSKDDKIYLEQVKNRMDKIEEKKTMKKNRQKFNFFIILFSFDEQQTQEKEKQIKKLHFN